jgi:hypothetical protein
MSNELLDTTEILDGDEDLAVALNAELEDLLQQSNDDAKKRDDAFYSVMGFMPDEIAAANTPDKINQLNKARDARAKFWDACKTGPNARPLGGE